MLKIFGALGAAAILSAVPAQADTFKNGGFESGNTDSWTVTGGDRSGVLNPLDPSTFTGSDNNRSAIINKGEVDPRVGSLLGSTVYNGNYSFRAQDTIFGGYATVIKQTVTNYTDNQIAFVWKAVLENGGHADSESAALVIQLKDLTVGDTLISRQYNAGNGGGGIDSRFSTVSGSIFYTPKWQEEFLAIDSTRLGNTFELLLLAADCQPTGHYGYAYIDGFGAALPPPGGGGVPEPATWALMILGFGAVGGAMRRHRPTAARVRFA